jgi:hypothetical protein
MPRTTRELLDIGSNHADGEEAVAATLSTPQGKGKQVVDHDEGTSSCFKKKKKKKNDKCRRDDNFVAVVERKTSRPKGNPTKPAPSKDHFERLLDASCLHHEVPVKHTLRECRLMKNYVNGTLKPRTADQSNKGGPSPDNDDGAGAAFLGEDDVIHMIFGGSPVLTVNSCIKVRLDLQANKSPIVVKGPFFPRVVNSRYRIRGTMCNARIQSSKAR